MGGRFISITLDAQNYVYDTDSINMFAPKDEVKGYMFQLNANNKLELRVQSTPKFKYIWQSCSYHTSLLCNEEF